MQNFEGNRMDVPLQAVGEQMGPASVFGCACSCIESGSVGVVQQFGKYKGYVEPGLALFCPGICTIESISLAVQKMDCQTQCKTKDNVTLTIQTALTYSINKELLQVAAFGIVDPQGVIAAQVDNIVRSSLPTMDLDEAYANKDSLSSNVLYAVKRSMAPYGYDVQNVLITDLSPDQMVLQAMNQINAARRNREAATEQAEGQKILLVKAAEADAEAKYLSGLGVARMRKAMAEGTKESMEAMATGGLTPTDAMHMMITTQYLDTLKDFALNPKGQSIMVPTGAAGDIQNQVRNGFIQGSSLTGVPHQMAM